MYQIGLLLLTGSFRLVSESISQYLKHANKNLFKRLYVKLEPDFGKPVTKSETVHLKCLSDFVPLLYTKASALCQNVDVRVILSNAKYRDTDFDVILTNSSEETCNIVNYLEHNFISKCDNIVKIYEKEFIQSHDLNTNVPLLEFPIFQTVCLGGTFDRLHNGHKVLLSEAALRATKKLIVGITDGSMLKKKMLWELIKPAPCRIADVFEFLHDIDPSLEYEVVPIMDPYGPTITDPDINCLVVSAETKKGGERVNAERSNRGMSELNMLIVNLVENIHKIPGEDEKLSSSTQRMHLLGTCLKLTKVTSSQFFTILLQGQPLTGKTYISNALKRLGNGVISCNEIITSIFNSNDDIKEKLCHKFNHSLLNKDAFIDFRKLVSLCLRDKEKRQWIAANLSAMVKEEVKQKLEFYQKKGTKLILIQDSILLDESIRYDEINELWSTIMPVNEIAKRLTSYYDLPEHDAVKAVMSMPSNEQYIEKSNRIFCTQWTTDITEQQISRAWSELKSKILSSI